MWGFPASRTGMSVENRAQGVPRRQVERERRVPERELLAVGGHHVLLRLAPRSGGAPSNSQSASEDHDAGVVAVLQERGPADVIVVCVAHKDVLDLGRIEAELAQPAGHLVLDRVVENRVDDDDARRGDDRPGRIFLFADEVEVVEHLDRLGVPGRPAPAARAGARPRASACSPAAPAPRTGDPPVP